MSRRCCGTASSEIKAAPANGWRTVTGILLEAALPVVVGFGLTAVLVRGLSSPRLCRLAARGSSWRRLFGILAAPAALVVRSSVGVEGEAAILAGGAVATEALLLAIGTGYRRLHLFPEKPRERVRDALEA